MSDYVAWFDGGCGSFNPGGAAVSGAIVKDETGTFLESSGHRISLGRNSHHDWTGKGRMPQNLRQFRRGHAAQVVSWTIR